MAEASQARRAGFRHLVDLRHDVVKILSRIARVLKDVRGCAAAFPLLVAPTHFSKFDHSRGSPLG